MAEEDLIDGLQERGLDLGVHPDAVIDEILDCDDLGLVMPLPDGGYALLTALLRDRTFTHRVTPPSACEARGWAPWAPSPGGN